MNKQQQSWPFSTPTGMEDKAEIAYSVELVNVSYLICQLVSLTIKKIKEVWTKQQLLYFDYEVCYEIKSSSEPIIHVATSKYFYSILFCIYSLKPFSIGIKQN